MITITGLSKEACDLLDIMWAIDTAEEYEQWNNSLDLETMDAVCVLEEMVMWAELDEITDEECESAKKVLDKIAKHSLSLPTSTLFFFCRRHKFHGN